MKWYYDLKIGTKLLSAFILVALIAGIIGYVGTKNIRTINKMDEELYEVNTVPLAYLAEIAQSFHRSRVNVANLIIEKDKESKKNYEDRIAELDNIMMDNLNKYEKTIRASEVRQEFNKLKAAFDQYKPIREKVINLAMTGQEEQALYLMRGDGEALATEIKTTIDKIIELKVTQAKQKSDTNGVTAAAAVNTMLILLVAGIALAIGLGLFITRTITGPVAALVKDANTAASGDLTADVAVNSQDEVGKLAEAYGVMIIHMRELVRQIAEKSTTVSGSAQQLNSSSQQTSAAASEAAATISEIATTVEQITSNIQLVSADTEAVAQRANEGNEVIARVNEQMQSIANSSKEVAVVIDGLRVKSNEINQIVELITSIADQTNLLALNAAIEAARAGEQGRGFAVVAEEVRKLAEQSANAAKEIYQLINAIQLEAQRAVDSVAQGGKGVEDGIGVVQEIEVSFKEIIDSVQNSALKFQDVASATEQMSSAVQNVAAATEEQTATMEEVSASAESLSVLAEELNSLVGKFTV